MLSFIWDEKKNKTNMQKHGISFEEAASVFWDDKAILFDDPAHSRDEDRFILLGVSVKMHICVVCHCYRENDHIIRIISARKATKKEVTRYERGI